MNTKERKNKGHLPRIYSNRKLDLCDHGLVNVSKKYFILLNNINSKCVNDLPLVY